MLYRPACLSSHSTGWLHGGWLRQYYSRPDTFIQELFYTYAYSWHAFQTQHTVCLSNECSIMCSYTHRQRRIPRYWCSINNPTYVKHFYRQRTHELELRVRAGCGVCKAMQYSSRACDRQANHSQTTSAGRAQCHVYSSRDCGGGLDAALLYGHTRSRTKHVQSGRVLYGAAEQVLCRVAARTVCCYRFSRPVALMLQCCVRLSVCLSSVTYG